MVHRHIFFKLYIDFGVIYGRSRHGVSQGYNSFGSRFPLICFRVESESYIGTTYSERARSSSVVMTFHAGCIIPHHQYKEKHCENWKYLFHFFLNISLIMRMPLLAPEATA